MGKKNKKKKQRQQDFLEEYAAPLDNQTQGTTRADPKVPHG
ncbi:MAG: hypothetical protein ACOYEK_08675 [bacterium]|jgi:hypothetical protein